MRPLAGSAAPSSAPLGSAWQTPVPYLFGGLAAMLGLIGMSLLILACSYCSHKRHNHNNKEEDSGFERDAEESDKAPKIVVIMAGDDMPTFIATPMCRAATFDDYGDKGDKTEEKIDKEVKEN